MAQGSRLYVNFAMLIVSTIFVIYVAYVFIKRLSKEETVERSAKEGLETFEKAIARRMRYLEKETSTKS